MKPSRLPTLVIALLALVAPLQAAVGITATGFSPKICNCTNSDASLILCNSSTVSVTTEASLGLGVPGTTASAGISFGKKVSTGQSGCATQTVAPGMCVQFKYTFDCEFYPAGWFYPATLDCYLKRASLISCPTRC